MVGEAVRFILHSFPTLWSMSPAFQLWKAESVLYPREDFPRSSLVSSCRQLQKMTHVFKGGEFSGVSLKRASPSFKTTFALWAPRGGGTFMELCVDVSSCIPSTQQMSCGEKGPCVWGSSRFHLSFQPCNNLRLRWLIFSQTEAFYLNQSQWQIAAQKQTLHPE